MVEIYNEEIKDLLGKGPPPGKKHAVQHGGGGTAVTFTEVVECSSERRMQDLMARAARHRAVGATASNEHSSRSHAVFMLSVTASKEATGQEVQGKAAPRYTGHLLVSMSFPAVSL